MKNIRQFVFGHPHRFRRLYRRGQPLLNPQKVLFPQQVVVCGKHYAALALHGCDKSLRFQLAVSTGRRNYADTHLLCKLADGGKGLPLRNLPV